MRVRWCTWLFPVLPVFLVGAGPWRVDAAAMPGELQIICSARLRRCCGMCHSTVVPVKPDPFRCRITRAGTASMTSCCPVSATRAGPDEHLYRNEPAGPDGDEVGVAVPFAAFQLVSVHDEHTGLAGLDQLQDLLRPQAARRREAPFQEFLFVDVVIVRAGEHEAVGNQPPGTAAPSLSPPGSARRCRRGAAWPRRACADRPATAARRSCCRWSRGSCRPHPPARRRWRPAARRHASRRSRGRPGSGW